MALPTRQVFVVEASLMESVGQKDMAPRLLNGSQAKTAYALRKNCESMVQEGGLNATGFLTLTVGDMVAGKFKQVRDAAEASRRINNLNRRVLSVLFEKCIVVTERHKSGAVHFHVLGVLRNRPDIRTGFDFEAVGRRDYRSASPWLRECWANLRAVMPNYGFGRSELTPIRETGEAVASYISKYIEKNIYNRGPDDYRKKLVRYVGWNKEQVKPNSFSWATPGAVAWRGKAREMARLAGCENREATADAFGPRWAFIISRMLAVCDRSNLCVPRLTWESYGARERVRNMLIKFSDGRMVRQERDMHLEAVQSGDLVAEYGRRTHARIRGDLVALPFRDGEFAEAVIWGGAEETGANDDVPMALGAPDYGEPSPFGFAE